MYKKYSKDGKNYICRCICEYEKKQDIRLIHSIIKQAAVAENLVFIYKYVQDIHRRSLVIQHNTKRNILISNIKLIEKKANAAFTKSKY